MHRSARALSSLGLALTLAACQVPGGTGPGKASLKPPGPGVVGPKGGALVGAGGASLIGMDGASLIGLDAASLVGADGGTLIGADGASLIGPDGASLIGPDGASLVGMDGASISGTVQAPAGLVAAGAGNAVSDMGGMYRLAAVAQKPLAGVHVYLRTASGRFLVDKAGKPLTAITNDKGEYTFKGWRAQRGITVFVPASKANGEVQGLAALRPKDLAEGQPVAIDAASSLMAAWVYDRVLASQADRAASLDRLPAALGAETVAKVAAAVGEAGLPKLGTKDFADALDRLRGEDAGLGAKLDEVKRVMTLAGTDSTLAANARAITLQQPTDVVQGPDGSIYVAEGFVGVVRRIDPTGRAEVVVGPGSRNENAMGALFATDLAIGPTDGKLYMNSRFTSAIYRCDPDGGNLELFAGGGQGAIPTDGTPVKAQGTQLRLARAIAFDPEGALVVAEDDIDDKELGARVVRITPDGMIRELPGPWTGVAPQSGNRSELVAFAVATDGAMWALEFQDQALWLKPKDGEWRIVSRVTPGKPEVMVSHDADLLPRPDGSVLLSIGRRFDQGTQVIDRFTRAGERSRFAGSGTMGADLTDVPAASAEFADPSGLAAGRDGSVLLADKLAGMVRAIGTDGMVRAIAGRTTGADVEAVAEPLNAPGGIAIDARGRIVVTEYAGQSIRRIEGDRSVRIAGGEPGLTPDGQRPDKLFLPAGLAFAGEEIVFVEQGNHTVRKIRADGTLETLVGGEVVNDLKLYDNPPRARDLKLDEPVSVAVSPAGEIYFNDRERIWKIRSDGSLVFVAGRGPLSGTEALAVDREGKPAREVPFGRSAGMAFDKAGNLYVAEITTSMIMKIDTAGIVTSFAGVGSAATFVKLLGNEVGTEGEVAKEEAAFVVPSGLAFDAQGNLYVTEMGTRGVQAATSEFFGGAATVPLVDGRIRKIDTNGRVTTIAGLGGPAGTALRNPIGLVIDPEGRVVFVDNGTNQLKRL